MTTYAYLFLLAKYELSNCFKQREYDLDRLALQLAQSTTRLVSVLQTYHNVFSYVCTKIANDLLFILSRLNLYQAIV